MNDFELRIDPIKFSKNDILTACREGLAVAPFSSRIENGWLLISIDTKNAEVASDFAAKFSSVLLAFESIHDPDFKVSELRKLNNEINKIAFDFAIDEILSEQT